MIVWLHEAHLSEENPALANSPNAPAVFVFDQPALTEEPLAFTRLFFVYECVQDVFATRLGPTHLRLGSIVEELVALAELYQTRSVVTTSVPGGRFTEHLVALEAQGLTVTVLPVPSLVDYDPQRVPNRFSAWWRQVEKQALDGA